MKKKTVKKVKKEVEEDPGFEIVGTFTNYILQNNEYSTDFVKWFHNNFKNSYPWCYDDFEIEHTKDPEGRKTIEILAFEPRFPTLALLFLFDDYYRVNKSKKALN